MSRSRAVVLGVLLVVAALSIWLLQDGGGDGADDVDRPERRGDDIETMIDVEGGPETDDVAATTGNADAAGLAGTGTTVEYGPLTVTVVAADGTPLPSVQVGIGPPSSVAMTDARGVAGFDDVPYDGSVSARAAVDRDGHLVVFDPVTPVRSPALELRVAAVARVVVTCRDALTGNPEEPESIEFWPSRGALFPFAGKRGERSAFVDLPLGQRLDLRMRVAPPAGFVVPEDLAFSAKRSPYVSRLEVDVPLRRELPLMVVIRDHEGTACPEAKIVDVLAAGHRVFQPEVEMDSFGNRRVRNIPFYSREPVRVYAEIPGTTAGRSVEGFTTTDPDAPVTLTINLPEPEPLEDHDEGGEIGIGGGAGGAWNGRSGTRAPLPKARLRVRVLRWNGEPAVGANVIVARRSAVTDASGVARFKNLKPGKHPVFVAQYGLLPIRGEVDVTELGEVDLTLREPAGASLELHVVDDLGRPLPFATVRIFGGNRPIDWPFEAGGVQRLDPYTDHRGRRTFARIPPFVGRLEVTWGSRGVDVPLELEAGETKHLQLKIGARPGAPR